MWPRRWGGWLGVNFALYGALPLLLAAVAMQEAYLYTVSGGSHTNAAAAGPPKNPKFNDGPLPAAPEILEFSVAERQPRSQNTLQAKPPASRAYIAPGNVGTGAQAAAIPLPSRNPKRGTSIRRPETAAGPVAGPVEPDELTTKNSDGWSPEDVRIATEHCRRQLSAIAAEAAILAPINRGPCGAPTPIKLSAIGANPAVRIAPAATVNCDMAAAIHLWVTTKLQPAAKEILGGPITKMRNLASYACRNRYSRRNGKLSEHAKANALDIGSFRTAKGQLIDIKTMWGRTSAQIKADRRRWAAAPKLQAGNPGSLGPAPGTTGPATNRNVAAAGKANGARATRTMRVEPRGPIDSGGRRAKTDAQPLPESRFLRKIHADACGIFSTVLGPEANEAHRDHFHFDLIERRRAFCE